MISCARQNSFVESGNPNQVKPLCKLQQSLGFGVSVINAPLKSEFMVRGNVQLAVRGFIVSGGMI